MKYVITGGAGFIGSNIVDDLIRNNHEVEVIDNFSLGSKENCNKKAKYHNYDISDSKNIQKFIEIFKGVDTIFHCAAVARVQPSIKDPIFYEKNNTMATLNILQSAVKARVKKIVYSSSSSVYGDTTILPVKEDAPINPLSPYGAQKYYGEILCKTFSSIYDIETVSLRYFNVYGEKQSVDGAYALVIGIFMYQKLNNHPLTIRGDGNQKRDFTYVGDVVRANILAAHSKHKFKGLAINIGNGDNKSINDIASAIGGETTFVKNVIEPKETLADNQLAKEILGWEPKTNVIEWIKKSLKT